MVNFEVIVAKRDHSMHKRCNLTQFYAHIMPCIACTSDSTYVYVSLNTSVGKENWLAQVLIWCTMRQFTSTANYARSDYKSIPLVYSIRNKVSVAVCLETRLSKSRACKMPEWVLSALLTLYNIFSWPSWNFMLSSSHKSESESQSYSNWLGKFYCVKLKTVFWI